MHAKRINMSFKRVLLLFLGFSILVVGAIFQSSIIGFLGLCIYAAVVLLIACGWGWLSADLHVRVLLGGILYAAVFGSGILLVYFFLPELTPRFVWAAFTLMTIATVLLPVTSKQLPDFRSGQWNVWIVLSGLMDLALLAQFFIVRTSEAIISPWSFISIWTFVLFALSTFVLLRGLSDSRDIFWYPVAVLHMLVLLCIAVIVYGIGFGFDPYMHRAAEEALVHFGAIKPKTVLYSAQYALVAATHHLTSIPVRWIDIVMVPLFYSLLFPAIGYFALLKGLSVEKQRARTIWLGIFTIPFMLLTFTVPFSMTYGWFLLNLLSLPWMMKGSRVRYVFILMNLLMVFFHPLLSAPLLIMTMVAEAVSRVRSEWGHGMLLFFGTTAIALSTPLMMAIYQWRQGIVRDTLFEMQNIGQFLNLFRSPYTDPYPHIPFMLDFIYDLRYFLPMIFTCAAISLWVYLPLRRRTKYILISLLVGLMICIFLLSTQFVYEGVIVHEQAEYALRLLQAWYMIPIVMLVFILAGWKHVNHILIHIALAGFIMHAWFFSYPQYNLKYPYLSPSVGRTDIEVVHRIDEVAGGRPYAVLTNQMMSAAAIQEFSFRDYIVYEGNQVLWYPLPTGGSLYALYTELLYNGVDEEILREFFQNANVDELYLVTHLYWGVRDTSAESYAHYSEQQIMHGTDLIIYQFCRYENCSQDSDKN